MRRMLLLPAIGNFLVEAGSAAACRSTVVLRTRSRQRVPYILAGTVRGVDMDAQMPTMAVEQTRKSALLPPISARRNRQMDGTNHQKFSLFRQRRARNRAGQVAVSDSVQMGRRLAPHRLTRGKSRQHKGLPSHEEVEGLGLSASLKHFKRSEKGVWFLALDL